MPDKKPKLSSSMKKELQFEAKITYGKLIWPIISLALTVIVGTYLYTVYVAEKSGSVKEAKTPEEKIQNRPDITAEDLEKEKKEAEEAARKQQEATQTPAPAPAPATPATENYIVVDGDTLGAIASAKEVTVDQIIEANPGLVAESLQIGQILKIPKR